MCKAAKTFATTTTTITNTTIAAAAAHSGCVERTRLTRSLTVSLCTKGTQYSMNEFTGDMSAILPVLPLRYSFGICVCSQLFCQNSK